MRSKGDCDPDKHREHRQERQANAAQTQKDGVALKPISRYRGCAGMLGARSSCNQKVRLSTAMPYTLIPQLDVGQAGCQFW